jgi:hypothetical protein
MADNESADFMEAAGFGVAAYLMRESNRARLQSPAEVSSVIRAVEEERPRLEWIAEMMREGEARAARMAALTDDPLYEGIEFCLRRMEGER